MKESSKSTKQQTKKIEMMLNKYSSRTIEYTVDDQFEDVRIYAAANELDCAAVELVLESFKNHLDGGQAPIVLLEWIRDSKITSEQKVEKALRRIYLKSPEEIENYRKMYLDSMSISKQYQNRNDKGYLRGIKVATTHNKAFYNYLVKKGKIKDYR